MNNVHCEGCGIQLQTDHKQLVGYIPKSTFEKGNHLCQRCFQLRHYNKNEPVSLTSDDFLQMVSSIQGEDCLVVHLIDIFDVDGTLLKSLHRITGNRSIILVGNKVDLLPKSTNLRKLKNWLRATAKNVGLNVLDVFLISSKKGHQIGELSERMELERRGRNIYVVGVTNVGKSTFINQLVQRSTGVKESITTSYFPGTTLGFISIPLDDHSAIIDTPGIINDQQIAHLVSKEDVKLLTPQKEIKPRNYQLNRDQTIFIGGLARVDFVKGDRQSFVFYFSNQLPLHRTKLENADTLYENQVGNILNPPNDESLQSLPPLVPHSYKITEPNTDIVISGLGWIKILSGDATVQVHCPKGVGVTLRKSFN